LIIFFAQVKLSTFLISSGATFQSLVDEPIQLFINVKLPNLDLKLGIKPKAGNFLSGKREGEGGRGKGGGRG
jgi:hypothetical protein